MTKSTLQLHCANKHGNECTAKLVLHFNEQIMKFVTKKEETGRYFFDAGEEARSEIENVQNYEANLHTHTRKFKNITDDDNHCHITTHSDDCLETVSHIKYRQIMQYVIDEVKKTQNFDKFCLQKMKHLNISL